MTISVCTHMGGVGPHSLSAPMYPTRTSLSSELKLACQTTSREQNVYSVDDNMYKRVHMRNTFGQNTRSFTIVCTSLFPITLRITAHQHIPTDGHPTRRS